MTRAAGRTATAVAALALVLGACGGSDDDDAAFKDDYAAESAKIERIGTDIAAAIRRAPSTSDADLARRFTHLADRADASAAALRKLDAPDGLSAERDELAEAVEAGSDDLRDVATAADGGDVKGGAAGGEALARDSRAIRAARRELDRLAAEE